MARDQIALMRASGFEQFFVVANDRGGRVGRRLAVDHPGAVRRLVVLDIVPTLAMYEQTTMELARAYWHWFFLIQSAPMPERLIESDPEFFLNWSLRHLTGEQSPFTTAALAEYLRCFRDPATIHGMCEDYRAAATIDLEHDQSDRTAGRRITCPLLALWGANGAVARCFDLLAEWRRVAGDVIGHALPCGHVIAEEMPEELLREVLAFLR